MKKHSITRMILFFLALSVDIKVKAVNIESPKGCLNQSEVECQVLANNKPFEVYKMPNMELRLAKGSSFVRATDGEVQLQRGLFWANARKETKIKSLYGELNLSEGAVLVEAQDGVVKFTNLSSKDLRYLPRGEKESHVLPVGYATYFSHVTKVGVADTGFPHPAEMEPLITKWTQVFSKSEFKSFEKQFELFLKDWRVARDTVANWYRDTADRMIAENEALLARQARLKAEREAAERVYRDLFRQRFLNP